MDHTCKSQRETIALGPVCTIERCGCGILHITIGPLTMRLEATVVESVSRTFSDAVRRLRDDPSMAHDCDPSGTLPTGSRAGLPS